jgi:phosphate starvation-inducible membrane PsiE
LLQKNNKLKIVVDLLSHYDILEFVQLIGDYMRGSIRMIVGFLIVFGAVGTIEVNPDANLLVQIVIAIGGLAVMLTGVSAMREDL